MSSQVDLRARIERRFVGLVRLAGWVIAGFGILSVFRPIAMAIADRDYQVAATYALFVPTIILFCAFWTEYNKKLPPLRYNVFPALGRANEKLIWPRPNTVRLLHERLMAARDSLLVLVGPSGAGKSFLVQNLLKPKLEPEDWETVMLIPDGDEQAQLDQILRNRFPSLSDKSLSLSDINLQLPSSVGLLIVLDQFEQFFVRLNDRVNCSDGCTSWLSELLACSAGNERLCVMLILRKEYYFDFCEMFPSDTYRHSIFSLGGIPANTSDPGWVAIRKSLEKVLIHEDAVAQVLQFLTGRSDILPVEVALVGIALENTFSSISGATAEELAALGGTDALLGKFASLYIDRAPEPGTCMRVLFALSLLRRRRLSASATELAHITHDQHQNIEEVLVFLKHHGLILDSVAGRFQIPHDYLAERIHEFTAKTLDAGNRENILYFIEAYSRVDRIVVGGSSYRDHAATPYSAIFVMGVLSVVLIFRAISPAFGINWGWPGLHLNQAYLAPVDVYYVPIAICHYAWVFYIYLVYSRFFYYIREPLICRLHSFLTVLGAAALAVVGCFYSQYWMEEIALGGAIYALKLVTIGTRKNLANNSKMLFWGMAALTLVNMCITFAIGLAVTHIIFYPGLDMPMIKYALVVNVVLSFFMLYYAWVVRNWHAKPAKAIVLLGYVDRRE